jgi:type VI secretion system ImpA family protein
MDGQKTSEATEAFEEALRTTPYPRFAAEVEPLKEAVEDLKKLLKTFEERLAGEAPALTNLSKALDDCQRFVAFVEQKIAPDRPPETTEADTTAPTEDGAPAAAPGGTAGAIATRADAYRQLERVAAELEKLEPHSPIPYLVRRAVRLGAMPFHVLIREFLRDEAKLAELGREFGLPGFGEAPPPPSQ